MDFAKVCALALAAVALGACHRTSDVPPATSVSPSASLIGTKPADPTGDPPGTTAVATNTTELSKEQETKQEPAEGQNHSYSTLSPTAPQKAGGEDPGPNQPKSNGSQS